MIRKHPFSINISHAGINCCLSLSLFFICQHKTVINGRLIAKNGISGRQSSIYRPDAYQGITAFYFALGAEVILNPMKIFNLFIIHWLEVWCLNSKSLLALTFGFKITASPKQAVNSECMDILYQWYYYLEVVLYPHTKILPSQTKTIFHPPPKSFTTKTFFQNPTRSSKVIGKHFVVWS